MKALIVDLDGTLVDTVYPHVLAWQLAHERASSGSNLSERSVSEPPPP